MLDEVEHYWEVLPVGAEFRLGFYEKWSLRGRVVLGGWGMVNAKKGHRRFSFEFGMRWLDMDAKN